MVRSKIFTVLTVVLFIFGIATAGLAQVQETKTIFSSEADSVANQTLLEATYTTDVPGNQAPDLPVLVYPMDDDPNAHNSTSLIITVADPDDNTLDVILYGREAEEINAREDFTLIALPDTQNESEDYPVIFTTQTQWIVDNETAQNTAFVTHLGDIVNSCRTVEHWTNADAAMGLLDLAGIPYSVGPGNHDLPIFFNISYYNDYFGISRFSGKNWYGGHFGSNNYNNYSMFSASGMDFILINLQYDPTSAMLEWADDLLKANADRRAIVVSHSIIDIDNSFTPQGTSIFNALKGNANLFLMLCGHMHSDSDGAAYRAETGDDGQTIHIMLADYQDYPNGGNGYLRILRFSPADNKIYATTHSPYIDDFITTFPDQMEMEYDMSAKFQEIGKNIGVTSGSDADVDLTGLKPSTEYEFLATVSDGVYTTAGPVWSFTTSSLPTDNIDTSKQVNDTDNIETSEQVNDTASVGSNSSGGGGCFILVTSRGDVAVRHLTIHLTWVILIVSAALMRKRENLKSKR